MCIQLPIIVDQKLHRRSVGNLFSVKQNEIPVGAFLVAKSPGACGCDQLACLPSTQDFSIVRRLCVGSQRNPQAAVSRARASRIGRINPPKIGKKKKTGKRENAILRLNPCLHAIDYNISTHPPPGTDVRQGILWAILRSRSQKAHLKGTNY
jgi:hypothetical protein